MEVQRRVPSKRRFSVSTWTNFSTIMRKHGSIAQMSDGRRCQVVLLDERRLEIVVQSKLYAGELLDIVASHFNLKEKEYFGLAFVDDTGQYSWLQLDKRVLDHEFPKKFLQGTFTLYFLVKYFVESITQLRDASTVEAFYLQAKSLLAKGELEVESETVFQLAALVLQATYGDYVDDVTTKTHLKRLPVLPTSALKEHLSIATCEAKVIEHYKGIIGYSRGTAIVNYLNILETLATYGQHYYEVKDKSGIPCLLGLSYKGISQYDKNDRRTPRKVFLWKQLENLYFRDKKFTIEVHEARRVVHTLSSFNLYEDAIEEPVEEFDDLSNAICDPTTQVSVSRRTLAPANVTVYVWYATSPGVTKCIWSMAIAQHQFFLDRSHRKSQTGVVRNLTEIAAELCHSVQSLSPASSQSNLSRSNSSNSIPSAALEGELSEESKAARIEMLTALRARKEALEDALKKKIDELRSLCLKEGELTGEIPPELPLNPGEVQPQPRKRIGTSFTLSDKIIYRPKDKERESLNQLELEYEIQSKITSAALRLASDSRTRKSVRKQRKACYQQESTKLRNIEEKLSTLKREKDLIQKKGERKSSTAADNVSVDEKSSLSNEHDVFDDSGVNLSGLPDSLDNAKTNGNVTNKLSSSVLSQGSSVLPCSSLPQLTLSSAGSAPPSPAANCRQRHQSLQHIPPSSRNEYAEIGPYETWRTPSTYSGGSEYDSISCGSGSIISLRVPYKNRFESGLNIEGTNLYSVPNRRASQAFDSQDDLLLDTRKSDSASHSSEAAAMQIDHAFQNSPSSVPLSASYDERLFYHGTTDDLQDLSHTLQLPVPKMHYSVNSFHLAETASLSSYDTVDRPNASVVSFRTKEKFNLFHSENSLHKTQGDVLSLKLENVHISEPDLNHPESEKIPTNVCSSSSLRRDAALKSLHRKASGPDLSTNAKNQGIARVADLVQASMLLQDGKRAASVSSLEQCAPKPKTKEWIETSLDSPVVARKQKKNLDFLDNDPNVADFSDNGLQDTSFCSDHIPSEHNIISLAPYPMHQFYEESVNATHSASETGSHQSNAQALAENISVDSSVSEWCQSADYSPSVHRTHNSPFRQYQLGDNQQEVSSSPPYYSVSSNSSENYLTNEFYSPKQMSCVPPPHIPVNSRHGDHIAQNNCFSSASPAMVNNISSMAVAEPQQPSKHGFTQHSSLSDSGRYLYEMPHELAENFQHFQSDDSPIESYIQEEQSPNQQQQPQCGSEHLLTKDISHDHAPPQSDCNEHQAPRNPECVENPSLKEPWSPPLMTSVYGNTIPLSPNSPQVFSYPPNVEVSVVSVGHFQPYWEETKPYELSDFYKYSTKHRKHQEKTVSLKDISNNMDDTPPPPAVNRVGSEWTPVGENSLRGGSVPSGHQPQINLNTSHQDCSIIPQHLQHGDMVVNAHVAMVDQAEYVETRARYSKEENLSLPNSPPPTTSEGNCSFGDSGLRISLADAFHEEMLAWYQDQDSVKKATLV